jgi:hypothetical protein
MGGPYIRGMRITVSAVVGQLAAGQTIYDVLADWPYVETRTRPGRTRVRSRPGERARVALTDVCVRLPIDGNLSLRVAHRLTVAVHDVRDVVDVGARHSDR